MTGPGISVRRAMLRFERAVAPVLDIAVPFDLAPGCALLVAPSGRGKTSLMRLLSSWYPAGDGAQPVCELTADYDPLRDVEFIGNHQTLFPWYSMRKNIAIRHGDLGQAEDHWAAVGLPKEAMDRYPYELSLGMYKRAELVTALSHDSRLLLLDEFFSSLDPEAREQCLRLILTQVGSTSSILITTHTPDTFPEIETRLGFRYGPMGQATEIGPLL